MSAKIQIKMMKLAALLIFLLSSNVYAECVKGPHFDTYPYYILNFKDARKDNIRLQYQSEKECKDSEKFIKENTPPFICSCEPALNGVHGLYCYSGNEKKEYKRKHIKYFSEDRDEKGQITEKSLAAACWKARKEKEDSYYKERINEKIESQRQQKREIQEAKAPAETQK